MREIPAGGERLVDFEVRSGLPSWEHTSIGDHSYGFEHVREVYDKASSASRSSHSGAPR
jgi:hypothetical protein